MQLLLLKGGSRPEIVEQPEPRLRKSTWPCFAVFVLAVGLCLLHNFVFRSAQIMLSTDGKHYLTTIQQLWTILHSGVSGPNALGMSGLGGHLLLDGPVMSVFYGLPFGLLSHMPGPRDWPLMAIGQSLFHGASAVLVLLLALRSFRSMFFACLTALGWAVYPNAVLETGHFMTETPVSFLCLALTFVLVNAKRIPFAALIAGFVAGLVVLGKPALIPVVLLVLFYGSLQSPNKIRALSASFAVVLCMFALWGSYFYCIEGKVYLTAQRQPTYNVAKGWNTEADGWGYNPHPPLTDLYNDSDGPLNTAYGLVTSHPKDAAQLLTRKINRLFALPWNDFKNRVLGLDMNVQLLIHRLLIALGLFGLFLFAAEGYKKLEPIRKLPLEIAILFCFGHLTYLMVESTARYSFTAMPFVALLAGYGLWQACHMEVTLKKRNILLALSICFALFSTALLVNAGQDNHAAKEIAHDLTFGKSVTKTFSFKDKSFASAIQSAFILVDGDKNLEQADIILNGYRLPGKLLSVMHYDARRYVIYDQMREFAPAMGINAADLRQWRAISIPSHLLNLHGDNTVSVICKSKAAVVYADSNPNERQMFSPDYCNYGLLASSALSSGAESRYLDPIYTAALKQSSFLGGKKLDESLGIRLALVLPSSGSTLSSASQKQESQQTSEPMLLGTIQINRKSFDPLLHDVNSTDYLRMNKVILYGARSNSGTVELPDCAGYSHLKLVIKGELKALKNPGDTGLLCVVTGKNKEQIILGKTPRALISSSEWKSFVIEDILPRKLFAERPESLSLALYPGPWMEGQYGASRKSCDVLFRNIKVEYSGLNLSELAGNKVLYY